MSTFENKSFKNVTLKSSTTWQCYTSNIDLSNRYITIPSIHFDIASDNFINTTYEVDVPSVDNEGKCYAGKDEEEFLNSQHNRSAKQTLKRHVQKLNYIFFKRSHLKESVY